MKAKQPPGLKAGARVRFRTGEAKGALGTVTRRPLQDGSKSIQPGGHSAFVFVVFDGTGTALRVPLPAIEKVKRG